MLRTIVYLSATLLSNGKYSLIWISETLVEIGLNSPRTSVGAVGLRSHRSCCPGPPKRNSTTHDFAWPNRRGRFPIVSALSAVVKRSAERKLKPARCSHVRRDIELTISVTTPKIVGHCTPSKTTVELRNENKSHRFL